MMVGMFSFIYAIFLYDAIFAAINFVVIFAWTDCIKKCNWSGDVVVCGGAWWVAVWVFGSTLYWYKEIPLLYKFFFFCVYINIIV